MTSLAFDCGNGYIKAVLVENKKIIDYVYSRNLGVVSTIQECLSKLKNREISSVGITGAGRKLATKLIGADIVKTEIIAQSIGVMNLVPNVRTVLDLGQEDSKILMLEDEVLTDFSMNSICGSGTGSYLENVASRFGINIEDYGDIALESKNAVHINSKCAVFGISSAVSMLNKGAKREDILMGISNALVRNYVGMLSKGKQLKSPYVFVGGVSNNKAIISSLEKELNHEVIVPKYNSVSAAFGIALMALFKLCLFHAVQKVLH